MDLSNLEVRNIPDPWKEGIAAGWNVIDGASLEQNITLEADVVIIGTGAGGGVSAEILSQAGLKVLMVEAARLKSSDEFDMQEEGAYRDLYQEGAGRVVKGTTIPILQGRAVGGTTVVNWTSSFRTPTQTLDYWTEQFGVSGLSRAELDPYFATIEQRLSIKKWAMDPNGNNDTLRTGCEKLGWSWGVIPRNVDGCWNLGYCGTGCPTNAKQSMLVTTLPAAMNEGATLVHSCNAQKLIHQNGKITEVICTALDERKRPRNITVSLKAKTIIAAGGGINTPALFLRSGLPDPNKRIGKRTFLHPTSLVAGDFDETKAPYYGAPQSIYSDQFTWRDGVDGDVGYKLEVMPLHPGLTATLMGGAGQEARDNIKRLPNLTGVISLLRDGFHEQSQGGTVELLDNGDPILDYPFTPYILEGWRHSHRSMVEILFAAGAKRVRPSHHQARFYGDIKSARHAVDTLPYKIGYVGGGSAHVMGGCAMGADERQCVVDTDGRFKQLDNLYVFDGSVFPTSLGVNPQLTIYGITARNASKLRDKLTASVG